MSLKTNVGRSTGGFLLAIQSGPTKYGSLLDRPSGPRPMRYSSLSLKDIVCLCADPRDGEAWEEFVTRVDKPIALTIMRTASRWGERSPSVVEDLRQDTYSKLCKDGCRLLRNFAIKHPDADDAIVRYTRKTAANTTIDHFKRRDNEKSGGNQVHVSTDDVDLEASNQNDWSQDGILFRILLKEIDKHLKHCLTAPDQERDRTIFWLYFRQGMSTKEIASLPTIGLTDKGVGSVMERLKHSIREQIVGFPADSGDYEE